MPANRDQPTMQDIADKVGVSKALVSLVFRNAQGPSAETRQRVLAAADELGYRINRAAALMTARRTHLIGVMANIRSPFQAELVEDIVAEADAHGYEVVLGAVTPTHQEPAVLETLLSFRCEALILLGPELSERELADLPQRAPIVVVGRRTACQGVDVVRTADGRGIARVVDHLVASGHRKISHLSGGSGTISADRKAGYLRAMKRHGLSDEIDIIAGDLTENAGMTAAHALLRRPQLPTAVVAVNDRSAIGLLDQLLRAGIEVPGDIAVTGYDDSVLARLAHIDMTTVSQEPRQQAERAVQAVVGRLDNGRTERLDVLLEPRLVVRRTTAPRNEKAPDPTGSDAFHGSF
ncbi:LacI family DNA-binding transcriptional regulator [Mycobacterium sp. LTG2003]